MYRGKERGGVGRSANEGLRDNRWSRSIGGDPCHATRHSIYAPHRFGLAYDSEHPLTGPLGVTACNNDRPELQ